MAERSTSESSTYESSTYEERHRRAAETFAVFVPDVDPERVAASLGRRLGALGTFAFDVVGEMWARPELSRRDRSLIVVSTLAAQARDEELELHTGVALAQRAHSRRDRGDRRDRRRVRGLPCRDGRQPSGRRRVARRRGRRDARRPHTGRREVGCRTRPRRCRRLQRRVGGQRRHRHRRPTSRTSPTRSAASACSRTDGRSARSGLATSWRVVTGRSSSSRSSSRWAQSPELAVHVPAGLGHGLTREEIEAAITHLALYSGFPRAVEAMRAAREAFARQR